MDYVHINPAKRGQVNRVIDWPYSTFHRMTVQGVYPADWAGGKEVVLPYTGLSTLGAMPFGYCALRGLDRVPSIDELVSFRLKS